MEGDGSSNTLLMGVTAPDQVCDIENTRLTLTIELLMRAFDDMPLESIRDYTEGKAAEMGEGAAGMSPEAHSTGNEVTKKRLGAGRRPTGLPFLTEKGRAEQAGIRGHEERVLIHSTDTKPVFLLIKREGSFR